MKKHKYLVTFYKMGKKHKKVCTRTYPSTLKFAFRHFLKYGIFTIQKIK